MEYFAQGYYLTHPPATFPTCRLCVSPLLGIPALLAATVYEIKLTWESLDDLDQLYSDMGMADETPDDVMHSVCHPSLPDAGSVWDGVVDKSGEWWGDLVEAV